MTLSLLPSTSTLKQDRVLKYLRQRAMQVKPGEALPGLRQVMADCQVGQIIAQRAIARLQEEGLLEASPRRGIFKSEHLAQPADLVSTIDVIYCTDRVRVMRPDGSNSPYLGGFHGELIEALASLCGQRGQGIRVSFVPSGSDEQALEEVLRRRDCQACIVVQADRPDLETAVFAPSHVPVVHLLPICPEPVPGSVVIDSRLLIESQIRYLWSLGHERIAYLHLIVPQRPHHGFLLRREHYYRLMAERGVTVHPDWVQFGGWSAQESVAAIRSVLRSAPRPTAVIVADGHLPVVYQELREHGLEPGRDFSVIGTDDLPLAAQMYPSATSLDTRRSVLARAAVDLLDRKLGGEPVGEVVPAPVRVVERSSTGPVK